MTTTSKPVLKKTADLTPVSDKKGIEIFICDPGWFDKKQSFKITNAPTRTSSLDLFGEDLNFVARVLYAESSGSAQVQDKAERSKEKEAILNVKHFRLNRAGYPNRIKAKTFTEVCKAPNQFESVYASSNKFSGSETATYPNLKKPECADLAEAIQAVKQFISSGPNSEYIYDNFRGGKGSHGKTIGLTRFWLSDEGKKMYEKDE
ncbi:hypothetical protein AAKU64_001447 [Undibacterium sp. GrIS 1.8]|uniref:hypothetical protein n=1 Tax=unclassified Undibacterium TaxID=2630295 RepID=UPI003390DAD2